MSRALSAGATYHFQKWGNSIFGVNSTFKSNRFMGDKVPLNTLDIAHFANPRSEAVIKMALREQIFDSAHSWYKIFECLPESEL